MHGENTSNDLVIANHDDNISLTDKVQTFIKNLGIKIDPEKLKVALCHISYIFENDYVGELEHLKLLENQGESLLNLIICVGRFIDSEISDNKLTHAISYEKERICFSFYQNNNLNNIILLGKGERKSQKEFYQNVVYQVLSIIFEETNFYKAYELLNRFSKKDNLFNNYRTYLHEYTQKHGHVPPQYKFVNKEGPEYATQFEVELTFLSQTFRAFGKSKKSAEQEAAKLFILKNQLKETDNTNIKSSPLRLGDTWYIDANRRKQLTPLLEYLGLDQSHLPLYMLDACFTHKSFLFKNSGVIGESFDNLSFLGSAVLTFAVDMELRKYFDAKHEDSGRRAKYLKERPILTDNLSKLFKPNWLHILNRGNLVSDLESKEVKSNIVQAIFGAVFLNAFQNKALAPLDIVSKMVNQLIPIREEIESVYSTFIESCSWKSLLHNVKTALRLEFHKTKLLEEGPNLKSKFIVLRVFHPLCNDLNFISEGIGLTRREATNLASKKILDQIKMNFNLSDYSIYCNSENWKQTLSNLISIALKYGIFQEVYLDLIGGLCLKTWSDTEATNILNNLYDNMLFSEIRSVYELWLENKLSEKADAVISSHPNSNELIELIFFKREVSKDSSTDVDHLELVINNEQLLEKNQNWQEKNEAGESLNLILDEESETIEEVMAKEQEVEIEKLIEEVKLDDETKLEAQETLKVEKNLETEIETTIDRSDIQREIDKSIDRHHNQYSGSQVIPQNPNMEIKVTNIISNSSKTKGKINTEKIQTHQSTKTTGSTKLCKVHSRIFRFTSEQCPYCGEKLNNFNRIFSVNHKTEAKYIESSVKCCLVCDICGLSDIAFTTLRERGLIPLFYQGSPTFFQSTVLTKALSSENIIQISLQEQVSATVEKIEEDEPLDLDEIINIPTKRQRVITPENLAKTLEFKNHIGLAGEKFVLEWERGYLEKIGRDDLAKQIVWEAQRNCAAGYDILSYSPDGTPKYIEVKSTSANSMSFEVTANEWEWAKHLGQQYSIYRVFNVFGTPQLEKFENPSDLFENNKIQLVPTSFRATLT